MRPSRRLVFLVAVFATSIFLFFVFSGRPLDQNDPFQHSAAVDGTAALEIIREQLSLGARFIGSSDHERAVALLSRFMREGSDVQFLQQWQHSENDGQTIELTNIIGRLNPENPRRVLLVTHYDSKRFANNDRDQQMNSVPGANDSASGVAVILSLAKELKTSRSLPFGVDMVLFDGEEWEEHYRSGAAWNPLGSAYFTRQLKELYPEHLPMLAIDIDMVCDKDLQIYKEASSLKSAQPFVEKFWNMASARFPEIFLNAVKWNINDDHTLLNIAGIPSFLIIDFDYPAFHTTRDTIDQCSTKSLSVVGSAVLEYLYSL